MDIKTMGVIELKSLAFDTLVEIERHQNNLRILNEEIRLRASASVQEVKPVKEKKDEAITKVPAAK